MLQGRIQLIDGYAYALDKQGRYFMIKEEQQTFARYIQKMGQVGYPVQFDVNEDDEATIGEV